jgi:Zn-dependent protease with chaperone function
MFAERGIAVSLSIFVILYSTLSVAVCCVWRRVWLYGQRCSGSRSADMLFALRMAPLVIAIGVTLALAVPSFLVLEPRSVDEPMSAVPIGLACCGLAMMLTGLGKAATALVRASRTVARWSSEARVIESSAPGSPSVPVLRISAVAPPLTAAGILRPRVWLSGAAEFVLSPRELQCALRHEVVHVRRRDNLRKLALRLTVFPGMAELERAWREATEMGADDAAVSSASEALDLAAALIKLSRITPLEPPAELTTALVHSPAASVNARVERLIAWSEQRTVAPGYSRWYALGAVIAVVVTFALSYSRLLVQMHEVTERLVR